MLITLASCSTLHSGNAEREFVLGNEAYETKNYDEAIRQFTAFLQKSPDNAEIRLKLGMAYLYKGNLKEAVKEFKQSIALDPENREVNTLIKNSILEESRKFARQGDEETSIRYLTAYLTIDPDDLDTNLALTRAFMKRGDTRNALGCLNKLVSLDPKNPEVIELLDYFSGGFH